MKACNRCFTAAIEGFRFHPGYLDRDGQARLLAAVRAVFSQAPLFTPRMPKSGRPFTVRMSNCGALGWVSDESGYRYRRRIPKPAGPGRQCPRRLPHCGTNSPAIRIRRRPA